MAPSTESTLEGLICRAVEIFPVAGNASDDHHSLVLLIGGPPVANSNASAAFRRPSLLLFTLEKFERSVPNPPQHLASLLARSDC
jgi:hypothetical protein